MISFMLFQIVTFKDEKNIAIFFNCGNSENSWTVRGFLVLLFSNFRDPWPLVFSGRQGIVEGKSRARALLNTDCKYCHIFFSANCKKLLLN